MRALASHQCGPGSNPSVDAICGLSLLLVLSFAPRGFSPDTPVFPSPQKPTLPNSNSIWNARTRLNEFIWTLKCFEGKKAIYNFFCHPKPWVGTFVECRNNLDKEFQYLISGPKNFQGFQETSPCTLLLLWEHKTTTPFINICYFESLKIWAFILLQASSRP